jgi:hypothetical protein
VTTTLMQLRRLTRSRLGVPITDDFFSDAILDDNVNLAVQAIEAEYRWPWAERVDPVIVTSAAPDIPTPDGWRATRAVFDGQAELYAVAPGDLLGMADVTGGPRVWCPLPGAIAVRPVTTGDRTLTHYWYRQPTWLAYDDDTADMPDQFVGAPHDSADAGARPARGVDLTGG